MKNSRKKLISLAQLAFGIGIVVFLLHKINHNYQWIEFDVAETSVSADSVYRNGTNEVDTLIVLSAVENGTRLRALRPDQSTGALPSTGVLNLCEGDGPVSISWLGYRSEPYGLSLFAGSFRTAARHFGYVLGAVFVTLLCIVACTLRWQALLAAQEIHLTFWKVLVLFFIGHYFNAFMPGAIGGDFVKLYYVVKETEHKQTEAVSTIFLDRIIGLLALIPLCTIVMLIKLDFFLSYPETKVAFLFNCALLVGAVVGLFVVFRQNLLEKWSFFRRLEERTALGKIIGKVYGAFHICFKCPTVLVKTGLLSVANHLLLVFAAFLLGRALEIPLGFGSYIMVFPIINAIAAIPATPGGLGTREVAAKFLLGAVGISEVKAVPLSLLLYATMLFWSLVGGVVYMVYSYYRGKAPDELPEEDGASDR